MYPEMAAMCPLFSATSTTKTGATTTSAAQLKRGVWKGGRGERGRDGAGPEGETDGNDRSDRPAARDAENVRLGQGIPPSAPF